MSLAASNTALIRCGRWTKVRNGLPLNCRQTFRKWNKMLRYAGCIQLHTLGQDGVLTGRRAELFAEALTFIETASTQKSGN